MNTINLFFKAILIVSFSVVAAYGQRYEVGDIVENFTLTDRETGEEVSLYDLEGQIVFLEWFAWWCPFCQAAADQIEPGIVNYYRSRAGNPNGVDFRHVAVNLQGGSELSTQEFVNAYNIETVWNDFDRSVADRFQSGGQPIFAIINGVANSPSHEQWELLLSRSGFNNINAPILAFRNVINAVEAGAVVPENPGPPIVTNHPLSVTNSAGQSASFIGEFENVEGASYQWFKDGTAISGANEPTYSIASIADSDEGDYTLTATTTMGTVESRRARLIVADTVDGNIVNMSVRSLTGRDGEPLIMGFVVDGGPKSVLTRGIGPGLADKGVSNPLPDPQSVLVEQLPDLIKTNDNWHTDYPDANTGVFADAGAFVLEDGSLDSVILDTISGVRTVVITDTNGAEGVALAELYDLDPSSGELVNVSARNRVGVGENVLIVGFVISGNTPKRLMIRGVGPKLSDLGVSNVLSDPQLELFTPINGVQTKIAENDDWGDEAQSDQANSLGTGAFELDPGSRDSMILTTLPAGVYSAILRGVGGEIGVGLLEVYLVR